MAHVALIVALYCGTCGTLLWHFFGAPCGTFCAPCTDSFFGAHVTFFGAHVALFLRHMFFVPRVALFVSLFCRSFRGTFSWYFMPL